MTSWVYVFSVHAQLLIELALIFPSPRSVVWILRNQTRLVRNGAFKRREHLSSLIVDAEHVRNSLVTSFAGCGHGSGAGMALLGNDAREIKPYQRFGSPFNKNRNAKRKCWSKTRLIDGLAAEKARLEKSLRPCARRRNQLH